MYRGSAFRAVTCTYSSTDSLYSTLSVVSDGPTLMILMILMWLLALMILMWLLALIYGERLVV